MSTDRKGHIKLPTRSLARRMDSPRGVASARPLAAISPKPSGLQQSPRKQAASPSAAAAAEVQEMMQPYGYDSVSQEDKRSQHFRDAILDLGELAGKEGLRHVEVRKCGNTHYKLLALGFQNPIHMDSLIQMMFGPDGNRKSASGIQDAYINPCVPTNRLDSAGWTPEPREPPCFPCLVVEVPTKASLDRATTTVLDNIKKVDLNGAAPLMSELFPALVDLSSGTMDLSTAFKRDVQSMDTVYTIGGAVEEPPRTLDEEDAPSGSAQDVECSIDAGSMSPQRRSLPRISVKLMSEHHIRDFRGASGGRWNSPVPTTPGAESEFSPFVRLQLDTMLQYMCSVHKSIGGRDSTSRIDVPSQLRIVRDATAPRTYLCQTLGWTDRICLVDMIRIYLCDPVHIKDVYFDFTCKPRDDMMAPGALVVRFEVETAPGKKTIARPTVARGIKQVPDPQQQQQLTSGPVSLTRIKRPAQEAPPPEEPAASAPEPPAPFRVTTVVAAPSPIEDQTQLGKRKAEEEDEDEEPAEPPAASLDQLVGAAAAEEEDQKQEEDEEDGRVGGKPSIKKRAKVSIPESAISIATYKAGSPPDQTAASAASAPDPPSAPQSWFRMSWIGWRRAKTVM